MKQNNTPARRQSWREIADNSLYSFRYVLKNTKAFLFVSLLDAYRSFENEPIQSDNILRTKKEIEDTLDTINAAFEKLLDDLFQTTAWDISSDISVLQTMLAQEGLTNQAGPSKQDIEPLHM